MSPTLMVGLTERDMQGVINTYDFKPYYFPSLFPLRQQNSLTWKTLVAQAGLKIAADIVARGASIPRKTREAIERIQGDIPKIAISREMNEQELTDYDIAVAMASGNEGLVALVEFWAEDMNFCWQGVASRIEWMALRQISQGAIKLSQTNNQNVVTEFDVDYGIAKDQKIGTDNAWDAASSAKPLADFAKVQEIGKKAGFTPRFAFMNQNTFAKLSETDEIIKQSASFAQNALGVSQTPDITLVNSMLARQPRLKGLQLVVIDQDITTEVNGQMETGNPFVDDVVMFSESKVLGNTYWKTPVDMKLQGTAALKVMNGPICVKKWSEEEVVVEVTQGIANAFPAWSGAQRSVLLDVKNKNFTAK
ncbi:major capsid protein [Cruoricaptor ignavus]|uniref:major capsid protein n=1 Tax=Cruoricaptor ignavus TaxID=1118202 RepID=UPI00370DB72D